MTDSLGWITKETDKDDWELLARQWYREGKPGTIIDGKHTYNVSISHDIPKFHMIHDEDYYNTTTSLRK